MTAKSPTYVDPIDGRVKQLPPGFFCDPAGELRERRAEEPTAKPRANGTHRNIAGEFSAKRAASSWMDAVNGTAAQQFGDPAGRDALAQWRATMNYFAEERANNG